MCGRQLYVKARQLWKWVCILTRQAAKEVKYLRVEQAQSIVDGCKEINLPLADADKLQAFLTLPKQEQYHRQVRLR